MNIKVFMKGFNYGQDGTGNRLVIHLQGCNMRCPWCSNPEGLDPNGSIIVDSTHLYPEICPYGAVHLHTINRDICSHCSTHDCLTTRNIAIKSSFITYRTEELLSEAILSKFLFVDRGGVTLTGGEPTLQFDAVRELLIGLKKANIHTAIETNGSNTRLPELFPLIDELIIDLKHTESEQHKKITGIAVDNILNNIKCANIEHSNLLIRTPLIHGYNDSEEALIGFVKFLVSLPHKVNYEVLTYHEYGRSKYDSIGLPYKVVNGKILQSTLNHFIELLLQNDINLIKT